MGDHITDYVVRCESCLVVIHLGVVSTDHGADDIRLIQALNELLVDYGWLPTRSGRYCRTHAAAVRTRRGREERIGPAHVRSELGPRTR